MIVYSLPGKINQSGLQSVGLALTGRLVLENRILAFFVLIPSAKERFHSAYLLFHQKHFFPSVDLFSLGEFGEVDGIFIIK